MNNCLYNYNSRCLQGSQKVLSYFCLALFAWHFCLALFSFCLAGFACRAKVPGSKMAFATTLPGFFQA